MQIENLGSLIVRHVEVGDYPDFDAPFVRPFDGGHQLVRRQHVQAQVHTHHGAVEDLDDARQVVKGAVFLRAVLLLVAPVAEVVEGDQLVDGGRPQGTTDDPPEGEGDQLDRHEASTPRGQLADHRTALFDTRLTLHSRPTRARSLFFARGAEAQEGHTRSRELVEGREGGSSGGAEASAEAGRAENRTSSTRSERRTASFEHLIRHREFGRNVARRGQTVRFLRERFLAFCTLSGIIFCAKCISHHYIRFILY